MATTPFDGAVSRRGLLKYAAAAAVLVSPVSALASALGTGDRTLAFKHMHTGEELRAVYWAEGQYVPDALTEISRIMRDFRNDEAHEVDPQLLDILHAVRGKMETAKPFRIVSAYRSPATNAMLRKQSRGVAKKSLHMQGRAIDVMVEGVRTSDLRKAAMALKTGGVGFYPKSGFVHLDTGGYRTW